MFAFRSQKSLLLLLSLAGLAAYLWSTEPQSSDAELDEDFKLESPKSLDLEGPKHALNAMPQKDLEAAAQIRAAYATGDYGRCLQLAETFEKEKERSSSFKHWLQEQMEAILTALGWLKLKTGRCDQAISFFKRAEAIAKSPEIAKGLGYCHYMNHMLDAAEENILWFMKHSAELDEDVLLIYSEVLESKGRFADAVKILESLSTIKKDPILKKKIAGMREKAKKANLYQTINTRYFSLSFEEDVHRDLAEKTLDMLEKALDDLILSYHFREPKKPIEVLLYSEQDFQNFTPESPLWAEALFNGRIRVPVHQPYDLNRLQTALRHELVHALFSQMTGSRSVPNWFDEGVAQLASNCGKTCIPFDFGMHKGKFLGEDIFERPFVGYKKILAQQVYRQSLYLVLTLKTRYKSGLQAIIENMKLDSRLDSQSLLQQLDTNFSELRKTAEDLWQADYTFGN